MGYHVSIINTSADTAAPTKMLNRPQDLVAWLREHFDFRAGSDDKGQKYFYRADDQERTLFYETDGEDGACGLWANGPDDTLLALMIDIARALGDGSRVVGDEGETYDSPDHCYTHPDDAAALAAAALERKSPGRRLLGFLLGILVPLLLGLMVFLFLFKLFKH